VPCSVAREEETRGPWAGSTSALTGERDPHSQCAAHGDSSRNQRKREFLVARGGGGEGRKSGAPGKKKTPRSLEKTAC